MLNLTEQQKEVIERIGIAQEHYGFQPAAARIVALLYVADRPELTFDEISEGLQISKSATSNALKLLQQTGKIEYATYAGDRKRYFKLKVNIWREEFIKQVRSITGFSELLRQVLEVRTPDTPEYNNNIKELMNFMEFVAAECPHLLEKWENRVA